jgi:hypothetical protein
VRVYAGDDGAAWPKAEYPAPASCVGGPVEQHLGLGLSLETGLTQGQLVAEGLNMVFAKHNKSQIAG